MSQLDSEKEEQTKSLVSLVTTETTCLQYIRQDDDAINTFSFLLFQSSAVSLVNLVTVSKGFTAEDRMSKHSKMNMR